MSEFERGKILIVEDNPDDEALCLRSLRKAKILNSIVVARDGVEALEILLSPNTSETCFALVLLDLNLPRLNGFQVLERIRNDERTRFLPVVIMTSSKEQIDRLRSYKIGCNSYVQKPIPFEAFSQAVAEIGMYWTLVNRQTA